jgi:hypothetical protein
VSALWRLNVAVAVARSRKLSPEELLAEIRSAGRREAEGIAAVKAGGGTMRAWRVAEEGLAEEAPGRREGGASALPGVEGISEGEGKKRGAGGPPPARFSGGVRCAWCGQEVARLRRGQKFCGRNCRWAAWKAETGYRRARNETRGRADFDAEAEAEPPGGLYCAWCGKAIEPRRRRRESFCGAN